MNWLGAGVATLGALLCLLAAVGLVRLRDPLSRLHPVSKASPLGVALCMVGTVLAAPGIAVAVKAFLAAALLTIVTPISGHILSRATYDSGLAGRLSTDELAEDQSTNRREGGAPNR